MSTPKAGKIKTFVIDTNVFIHRPDAVLSFCDNEVVIPLWVLEELDRLKSSRDERGRNARQAIRFLDEHGRHGNLREGVKMENGSILKVVLSPDIDAPKDLELQKSDNRIILTAYSLQQKGKHVFFVSKDINARVKAKALGIKAVDYEKQTVDIEKLYKGYREIETSSETLEKLKSSRSMAWNEKLYPNEFIIMRDKDSGSVLLGRFNPETEKLNYVRRISSVYGIKPLNDMQKIAFNLLLDDSVSLVTLVGKAGTGKTLLAIAAGLKKVMDDKCYSRVLVTRPIIPMGKDLGYLPGAKSEKLSHWMQPLFDNLEYIISVQKDKALNDASLMIENNMIEIEALTYIRGRSLPRQFIVIDEAQNLSPHEVKTIVSRAGEGTKVILTGDPFQIDSPYLDANSNGLSYLVEAFKGQKIFGHVILQKTERSQLAELAAELL
jgi:PhoH-like ATPase